MKLIELKRTRQITRNLIKTKVKVHNGKEFHEILILPKMVNYKAGEFSLTKKKVIHKLKKK